MKSVSNNANRSLFVADFAVHIKGKHRNNLRVTMQLCNNKLQTSVAKNDLKFSFPKKKMCPFSHLKDIDRTLPPLPPGQVIPVKEEVKCV